MRRRDFIKAISVWTALPLAARAQPREQKRRVAVLMGGLLSGDLGGQAEAAALEAGLTELGWKLGSNIELEYRWPGAELDQVSIAANEIVAMRPDLVVSRSTPTTGIMMNRGLPIVFVLVTDPLFSGFVQNLGRPGGNVTGFSLFESSVGGKWLALLKEAAPAVSRVSLLFNPETAPFADGYRRSAEAAAPTVGTTVVSAPCGNAAHIISAFEARAREGGGGIIGIPDTFINEHRDLIIELAACTTYLRCTAFGILSRAAGYWPTQPTLWQSFTGLPAMSIKPYAARALASCRWRRRISLLCQSISEPPEQLVLPCHKT
jgi:putative ABC transport system substrate-binding protein